MQNTGFKSSTSLPHFTAMNETTAVEALIFNALINALLKHPCPSTGRAGGSYPGPRNIWEAPPVNHRKLENK